MFINISNHPSEKWGKEQIEAANEYGKIVDITFPNVSPEASALEVEDIAYGLLEDIREMENFYKEECRMVHLVGEPTLTVAAVSLILSHYPVCTSTTKRIVTENQDGTITKAFKFERFREYRVLSGR